MTAGAAVRACHLIHDLGAGGAEHVLVDLARVAPGAGIEMSVVSMMPLTGRRYPDVLRDLGVPVHSLGLPSRWDPRGPRRLAALLAPAPPQVLHSHLKHADVVGAVAAGRLGLPLVSTLHVVEEAVSGVARLKRNLAARIRVRRAALTIAVSGALRDWYLEFSGADPERVVVLPNGIPAPDPVPEPRRVALRADLGIPPAAVVAMTAALFRPGKGHADLIDAARRLAGRPDLWFVLAGSGPEEDALRRRAADLDRVVFAGFREDVGELLAAGDLIVHPSHADALPTALIHGQAAGLPAVATAVGGIPEIVTPGTGVLVEPGRVTDLAAAIDDLAADASARRRLGDRARESFTHRFEGGIWAGDLKALYDRVIVPGDRRITPEG
jgi:glycosyltransferase involved in cell wall biosynthesis